MDNVIKLDSIDLSKIAKSGQCFRWKPLGDGRFLVPAYDRFAVFSQRSETEINILYSSESDISFWETYFDASEDYERIRKGIDKEDEFLKAAADNGKGLRILCQEPFETFISFIISQRKNIPAITSCVESICRAAGEMLGSFEGEDVFSFPKPKDITEDVLMRCSLGYRLPYVLQAARAFEQDPELSKKLSKMPDEELLSALQSFLGVGIKVASCTALFGFHRMNVFPIDVWMKRALLEHYPDGFDLERYSPFNGLIQQYIFEYYKRLT